MSQLLRLTRAWFVLSILSFNAAECGEYNPPGVQVSQLLRLNRAWSAGSFIPFPATVSHWASGGWLCRAYLVASLGVLQPLCMFTALFICAASVRCVREVDARDPHRGVNRRSKGP